MMKFQKQVMSAGVSEKDQGLKMKNYFEILWNSKDFLISYKLRNDSYMYMLANENPNARN